MSKDKLETPAALNSMDQIALPALTGTPTRSASEAYLEALNLKGTKVTDAGIQDFAATEIERNGRANTREMKPVMKRSGNTDLR